MFASFNEYTEWVRPKIDVAFKTILSGLTEGIALKDGASFEAALVGGKKIRGCLLCLIANCLDGVLETAIPRAVAVELIQAATLLHDDYVDQDTVRRDRPATWTLEGSRRTVLLGDFIFASAIKMMNDLGWEDGSIISNAIAQVSRGAIQEPIDPLALARDIESNRIDGRFYETIIYLKTGNLFAAACRLGAIAAGADRQLKESAERYGLRIGEAYQITDDLQEIERSIKMQSISAKQMVGLAPACLYFVKDMRPLILATLREDCTVLSDELISGFEIAVKYMEDEIKSRLQLAVSEIEAHFPQNECNQLARQSPWDLIKMFNRVESPSIIGVESS